MTSTRKGQQNSELYVTELNNDRHFFIGLGPGSTNLHWHFRKILIDNKIRAVGRLMLRCCGHFVNRDVCLQFMSINIHGRCIQLNYEDVVTGHISEMQLNAHFCLFKELLRVPGSQWWIEVGQICWIVGFIFDNLTVINDLQNGELL